MTQGSTTASLGAQRCVSLTTFRKDGTPVATPVWITPDGDALVVTTLAASYKVKRLRRDPRVRLVPCTRTGKVHVSTPPVEGTAEIVTDQREIARMTGLVRRKYGLEYRLVMLVERLATLGRRDRVMLRITLQG
ncbi:PPOX class F420-dependent oxidoreductase [Dactylosporangium sp. NPDC006015]|uniref:PPOX class F420-dependent oxidoreductase n=1 Tax=Dactylosporangium sp. NPDC006015 TaxID=3154576 RepID=UPI0033BA28CB